MLKRIVAGVDGQPGGRDAAALAAALAVPGSDVLLSGVYTDSLLPFPLVLSRDARVGEQAETMLREVREQCAPSARTHAVCDTFPARALRHLAEREHADVLVLGSTHRGGHRHGRAVVGRTARQVLHDAPCPVALAARGLADAPHALRRIVVGFDGSPESRAALAAAKELARADDAQLDLVTVVDERLPANMMPLGAPLELAQWDEIVEQQRVRAQRLVDGATSGGGRMSGQVRIGDPSDELAQAAQGADLLVVGSRRWGPLARIVIGSTGEELLRCTPCSLLLVPRPREVVETSVPASAGAGSAAPAPAEGSA